MLTQAVKNIGFWIMLIFLILSVFIISNTIRLGMTSHSEEIKIMRVIGATESFIRTPFVLQGFILGAIGAVIASITLTIGYGILISKIVKLISVDVISFVSLSTITIDIVPLLLGIGIIIGTIASYFTVGKYIK